MSGSPVHVALLGPANSVHLQRWASALHERGRRVSVISQQAHLALPLPDGVTLHALPFRHGAGYFANVPALRLLLRKTNPDLLHANYATGYGTLARFSGWHPRLLSVWGSDVYEFPALGPLQAWWLRGNLRAADALASTSHAMAAQVRRVCPQIGPIAVTPFGVDLDRFAPTTDPRPDRPFTIGTVKTLAPAYGIDLLIAAFAVFRRHWGEQAARLLVVGDGPQDAALRAQAGVLGVEVDFAGAVPHADVPSWLHKLDLYVAPSRIESFGVAVVEAMACGVPVVVSDAGGLPEVTGDGRYGRVVAAGDVQALAEALLALARDETTRGRMAREARIHVEQAYAWQHCVDLMIRAQDRALAASRTPR